MLRRPAEVAQRMVLLGSSALRASDLAQATDTVRRATPQQQSAGAGLYLVRTVAVTWLFDERSEYFG